MPRSKKTVVASLPAMATATADDKEHTSTLSTRQTAAALSLRAKRALGDVSNRRRKAAPVSKKAPPKSATQPSIVPSPRRSVRLAKMPPMSYVEAWTESSGDEAEVASTDNEAAMTRGGKRVAAPHRSKKTRRRTSTETHDSLLDLENMTIPKVQTTMAEENGEDRKRTTTSRHHAKDSRQNKRTKTAGAKSIGNAFALPNKIQDDESYALSEMAPIDKANAGKVLHAPEYATSIYQHLYSIENRFAVKPYTDKRRFLDDTDRAEVIDAMVYSSCVWHSEPSVVFLAVQIVDRYASHVSQKDIDCAELVEVAAVALFTASKHDEVEQLTIRNVLAFLQKHGQTSAYGELFDFEAIILWTLGFQVSGPTCWSFLQRFLTVMKAKQETKKRALYFLECTLYVEELLKYRPSEVAATVACLAIRNPASREHAAQTKQHELLEYTQFPLSVLCEIAEIFQSHMKHLIPGEAEEKKFQKLSPRSRMSLRDKTGGFAAWIKYGRNENLLVSRNCDLPKVQHICDEKGLKRHV